MCGYSGQDTGHFDQVWLKSDVGICCKKKETEKYKSLSGYADRLKIPPLIREINIGHIFNKCLHVFLFVCLSGCQSIYLSISFFVRHPPNSLTNKNLINKQFGRHFIILKQRVNTYSEITCLFSIRVDPFYCVCYSMLIPSHYTRLFSTFRVNT